MVERDYSIEEFIDNILHFAEDQFGSKREFIELALTAAEVLGAWECFSCGVDTFALGEDFYVHDELWRDYGVEGMLCIGCLERRLGRKLTPEDFKGKGQDRPAHFPHYERSESMKDRVGDT